MIFSDHFINKTALWFEKVIERADRERVDCAADFPWTAALERELIQLSEELTSVKSATSRLPDFHSLSEAQKSITDDDKWKVLVLYAYTKRMEESCSRYPLTTKLVERIPGMTSAMFSVLMPHKYIPPHRGPYKGILRLLIPLKMPVNSDECYIKVKGKPYYWKEGKCFIFDDSLQHEVFNNTEEMRIALFVDFYRPLPFPFGMLNRLVYRFIVKTKKVRDAQEKIELFDI